MELSVKVSHFMEGDLCVTSHISWKYGCIYIYIFATFLTQQVLKP